MMDIFNKLNKDLYFMTDTVVDWVDIFTRPCYKHIVIESLQYCVDHKGLIIYAWVLMSNHLHTIVSCEDNLIISDIWRDFKKFTSKKILKILENDTTESRRKWMLDRFEFSARNDYKIKQYKFWQDGSDVQLIFSHDYLQQKLNYIHYNPVEAEFVNSPEEYRYSSAIDYADGKGLLKIEVIR
jgi:REP element-mobilizing transposase RayT